MISCVEKVLVSLSAAKGANNPTLVIPAIRNKNIAVRAAGNFLELVSSGALKLAPQRLQYFKP